MYKFIYYYFFLVFKKKNPNDALAYGSAIVFVSLITHILIVLGILERIFEVKIDLYPDLLQSMTYGQRKYALLPVAMLVYYFFIYKYFDKHHKQIEKKYDGVKMFSLKKHCIALFASLGAIVIVYLLSPKA